jgi:CheY-like chemotaxis protein
MEAYVLVVDDDPAVRAVVSETLRGAGCEVVCASDGRQALEAMQAGPLPDLVLLDLMMPRMSGWQVLDAMRRVIRLSAVPVVVLTASDVQEHLHPHYPVLHKAVDSDLLLAAVRTMLEQTRTAFSLEEPPSELLPRGHLRELRPAHE